MSRSLRLALMSLLVVASAPLSGCYYYSSRYSDERNVILAFSVGAGLVAVLAGVMLMTEPKDDVLRLRNRDKTGPAIVLAIFLIVALVLLG